MHEGNETKSTHFILLTFGIFETKTIQHPHTMEWENEKSIILF